MSESRAGETASSEMVDEALNEHASCMKLVEAVEECLDRHPDDASSWVAELERTLSCLRGTLQAHFTDEEAGPVFRNLPKRFPRLAGPLGRLESEHPELLRNIDEVIERARALKQPELFELRELNARAQLFIARFRRHEAAENEIVLEAYWDDFGGGD